jgi:hypothetical protein
MKTKICSKCKRELLINEFYKDKKTKDKLYFCCKKCMKIYNKDYYEDNKEGMNLRTKKYYKNYQENLKNYAKIYRKINKKQIKLIQKTAKRIYCILRCNAKNRGIKFNLNKEDFIQWYNSQEQKCHYCGRTLKEIQKDKNECKNHQGRLTIDRKDNYKGYKIDNICLACYRCNTTKSNYFTEQEMLKIALIIKAKTAHETYKKQVG